MYNYHHRIISWTRTFRTKKLTNTAKKVAKLGITPNQITFLSLITGIISIYFMYDKWWIFATFGLLHLLLDGFDGVLARVTKSTNLGKYFDLATDNLIALLILIQTALYLNKSFIFIIAALFAITIIIHFISQLKAPVIFIRTGILLGIMLALVTPYLNFVLAIGYYGIAILSIYILIKQIHWKINS